MATGPRTRSIGLTAAATLRSAAAARISRYDMSEKSTMVGSSFTQAGSPLLPS
jgi:hypothetical protein